MNLILFEPAELSRPVPLSDPRAVHILKVLRRKPDEPFDAGIVDGPKGRAAYHALTPSGLELRFVPETPAPHPEQIRLLIGLPRPQTARKILQEATSIGVGSIHFVQTSRGDPAYARSTLWSSGEYRRHLISGTEQAFTTRLPLVIHGLPLAEALAGLSDAPSRLALDNYEAVSRLIDAPLDGLPAVLAIGPERGWTKPERDLLRATGFRLADLGPRVLRSETAAVAGLAILRARFGL